MAKIRGIKPETWTDERFVSVSPLARLMFIGMWNFACDNGHLDDSPMQLKMRILPVDNFNPPELLEELVSAGLVERLDGFLKLPNLAEHQKVDKRFVTRCDHCAHDENVWFPAPSPAVHTSSARRDHHVRTVGSLGDGDGDGELNTSMSESADAEPRPDVEEILDHLETRLHGNGSKVYPRGKKARDAIRLLIDNDHRTPEQIHHAIDWSQDDEFWRGVILSASKLREKYDQLRLAAQRKRGSGNVTEIPKPKRRFNDMTYDEDGRQVFNTPGAAS